MKEFTINDREFIITDEMEEMGEGELFLDILTTIRENY